MVFSPEIASCYERLANASTRLAAVKLDHSLKIPTLQLIPEVQDQLKQLCELNSKATCMIDTDDIQKKHRLYARIRSAINAANHSIMDLFKDVSALENEARRRSNSGRSTGVLSYTFPRDDTPSSYSPSEVEDICISCFIGSPTASPRTECRRMTYNCIFGTPVSMNSFKCRHCGKNVYNH